ncbi:hypothetical protein BD410DRAFT_804371 [Rickenella mellea]|uniref:Uncharacterized protein n=1 Tax=Rickenella mellea TaxID=50990 RepID=A0A4Y7Q312_9AGAM|nr:hypothetical protein BD410DRAFT_804371 [Rickenella mellea]
MPFIASGYVSERDLIRSHAMPALLQRVFQDELDTRSQMQGEVWSYDRLEACLTLWPWIYHTTGNFLGRRVAPSGIPKQAAIHGRALPYCLCAANPLVGLSECHVQMLSELHPAGGRTYFFRCRGLTRQKPYTCLYNVRLLGNEEVYGSERSAPFRGRRLLGCGPANSSASVSQNARYNPYLPRRGISNTSSAHISENEASGSGRRLPSRKGKGAIPAELTPYSTPYGSLISNYLAAYNSPRGIPSEAYWAFTRVDRFCANCARHFAGDENHDDHLIRGTCERRYVPTLIVEDNEDQQALSDDDSADEAAVVQLSQADDRMDTVFIPDAAS